MGFQRARCRLAVLPLVLLPLGAGVTACGGEHKTTNAEVDCAHEFWGSEKAPCNVTFERGAAKSSAVVFGTEIELMQVARDGEQITLKVAGVPLTVRKDSAEGQRQSANLMVSIRSIDREKVVVGTTDSSDV
ncbi:hypothetical protein [Actinomadura rudentiformis]|uniref:Lipoprotein n=1 Tax=Actinomadura rudentiformis TaxID=359158 RepID=A0A6H9YXW0_9ACTN|nr:hypothetical protein [Actinomadura rudentiformis]KAB2346047.1 hypothetical protein F8566_25390 [Actinomadura rudentiformis]